MDILALSRRIPLFGFFGGSASDDDFADRLNYKYTVAILVIFAFIVTNKHFGHNQINCWVPAMFSKNFEEYTNLVCWITNTYYIPFDKQIPTTENERRSTELRYYQWVAYILLLLSLFFYLPRIIWRTLSLRSGVDIKDVIEASHDFKSVNKLDKNRKMMEYMIGTIDQYVDDPRRQHANRNMNIFRRTIALTCFMLGKFLGNYLVILYFFVKILYIANCVGQLALISVLLGRNFYMYGTTIFKDIIQGKGYADSEYFPRVTMCKFQVRELGLKNYSHEYNVQCVLPINLFNQQIFTFLWFWYLILLVINTSTLMIWIYRFIPRNQYNYAIRRVKLLRIRLEENLKVPKDYRNRFTREDSISREFNRRDTAYSGLFPNIQLNQQPNQYIPSYMPTTTFNRSCKNSFDSSNEFPLPMINEYNSYMSSASFTSKNYKEFVHHYLEADGMFMLRMIGSNSGDFVCTQVLHNLWKLFLYKKFSQNDSKNSLITSERSNDENEEKTRYRKLHSLSTNLDHEKIRNETTLSSTEPSTSVSSSRKTKHKTAKRSTFIRLFSFNFKNKKKSNVLEINKHAFNRQVPIASRNPYDLKRFQSIKRVTLNEKISNR